MDTQTLRLFIHLRAHLSRTSVPSDTRPMRSLQFTLQQSADDGPTMQIR